MGAVSWSVLIMQLFGHQLVLCIVFIKFDAMFFLKIQLIIEYLLIDIGLKVRIALVLIPDVFEIGLGLNDPIWQVLDVHGRLDRIH